MSRLLILLFILAGGLMFVRAQVEKTYSESMPYEPRKFEKEKSKPKKKKDPDEKNASKTTTKTALKIPVFVYNAKSKPVADLKKSDVSLFIDDREQEITAFEIAEQPLDLLLVVDMSPSTAYKPEEIKAFVAAITEGLKPQDKIQLASFAARLRVLSESTDDKQELEKALKKLDVGGGTSVYDAVDTIFRKVLKPGDRPKTVILISDGVDTTSASSNFIKSLMAAEKSTVPVFPFYLNTFDAAQIVNPGLPNTVLPTIRIIGTSKKEYEHGLAYIEDLAKLSGGRSIHVKNITGIKAAEVTEVLQLLRPQYFLTFELPEDVGPDVRKQIKIRINRPGLQIQARGSYITPEK